MIATVFWAVFGLLSIKPSEDGRSNLIRFSVGAIVGLITFGAIAWLPRFTVVETAVLAVYGVLGSLLVLRIVPLTANITFALWLLRRLLLKRMGIRTWAIIGLIVAVTASNLVLVELTPQSAWDALIFWSRRAMLYLSYLDNGAGGDFRWAEHRHPLSFSQIVAFSIYLTGSDGSVSSFAVYALTHLSLIMLVIAFSMRGGAALVLPAIYVCCSVPIFTNHILLVGYVDFFVAILGSFLIIVCSHESLSNMTRVSRLLIVLVLAGALTLTKNLGVVVTIIALSSSCAVIFFGEFLRRELSLLKVCLVLAVVTGAILACTFVFNGKGLVAGGKPLFLASDAVLAIPASLSQAVISNVSFSLIPIGCAVIIGCTKWAELRSHEMSLIIYAFGVGLFQILIMCTEYGLRTTEATSDLGGTRFLMTPVIALLLAALSILSRLVQRYCARR